MTPPKHRVVGINNVYRSGSVTRWHTNPWLAQSCDRIDGHQGRVARLALALFPDASRDLLIAALTHDDGESVTGDIPYQRGKTTEQENAETAARITIWNQRHPMLSSDNAARLRFCDRLDAAMWMLHFAPQCEHQSDWQDALTWLDHEAHRLGLEGLL